MPFYISIFKKMIAYRLFKSKAPMYGSVDVNNVCNLHCTHCYWWLNRKEEQEHAAMVLEWIRRRDPAFDAHLRDYLFTEGRIVGREEEATGNGARVTVPAGVGSLRRPR